MNKSNKFSPEVRERAVRMVLEHRGEYPSLWAAVESMGVNPTAGTPIEAFRLSSKSPTERARATWAQLRQRDVDALEVIAAWIAVTQRLREDSQQDRHEEYRNVQVAKLIHRMAGGTHKRWNYERTDGGIQTTDLHKYPVSRGQVLRVLGRQIAAVCEALTFDR